MAANFPNSPSVGQKYPVPAVPGQPVYTWDGEKWTTIGGTLDSGGISSALPLMDGTASAGVSTKYPREDHVHPSDTSRAPLASPVFTGDPKAPTPTAGDNDTSIATTAFVNTAAASAASSKVSKTGDSMSGNLTVNADIYAARSATVGYCFLGTNTAHYVGFNGSNYYMPGASLSVDGHFGSSDGYGVIISSYQPISGGYFCMIADSNPNWNPVQFQSVHVAGVYAGARIYAGGPFYDFRNDGAFKAGGGVWADNSDERIKNIIGDYKHGLAEVVKLQPIMFTFKGNDTDVLVPEGTDTKGFFMGSVHAQAALDGTVKIGLSAQEADKVMPEMVTKRPGYIDGVLVDDLHELDSTPLIFALVNAVKELTARVEALESGV